jgi:hypothetical protein
MNLALFIYLLSCYGIFPDREGYLSHVVSRDYTSLDRG